MQRRAYTYTQYLLRYPVFDVSEKVGTPHESAVLTRVMAPRRRRRACLSLTSTAGVAAVGAAGGLWAAVYAEVGVFVVLELYDYLFACGALAGEY